MSTAKDNTQNNGVIQLEGGAIATPNGDGTYTISGGDPEDNGVWEPANENTPGAEQMDAPGTQFHDTWWVKVS